VARREHDLLGEREVPAEVYWGIHTLRASENFRITGTPIGSCSDLIVALACVKQAAAEANAELGLLTGRHRDAIVAACTEIRGGALHDQFVVDVIQGGAGTSTNMNANEVIANRALELLGCAKGDYAELHPMEHVNLCQSTNDVYPTSIRLALIQVARRLDAAMLELAGAFEAKAEEFADVVKIGRTQLQDAVPMTLGQEFGTYAVMLREDVARLRETIVQLHEINLGATAIGTGITAPPGYAPVVCNHLVAITDMPLKTAPDLVEATQDVGAPVLVSGVFKRIAVKLSKVCNDLRLLSSGPQAGLGEIRLPTVQAGSSIMPGKVNPVIPETVNQIAFEVVGRDITVTMAAEAGQLQLNAFEPVMFRALHESASLLCAGCETLVERCVPGITANRELLRQRVSESVGVVTALSPRLGYDAATDVVREALESGRSVAEVVLARGALTEEEIARILDAGLPSGRTARVS
jgi:aspartate ammonia-lyase